MLSSVLGVPPLVLDLDLFARHADPSGVLIAITQRISTFLLNSYIAVTAIDNEIDSLMSVGEMRPSTKLQPIRISHAGDVATLPAHVGPTLETR